MSTNQGQSISAIPVWDAGNPPVPGADGLFPTDRGNPNGAIPVYQIKGTPTDDPAWPNDQGKIAQNPPQGALPVRIVEKPVANVDGSYPCDPANDNSAIPVYFVGGAPADAPPYSIAQSNMAGAVPVWIVS